MMKFLLRCPLFVFVLILYNIIIFTKPDLLLEPRIQPEAVTVVSEEATGDGNVTTEEVAAAEDFPPPVQKEAKRPQPIARIPLISGAVWEPVVADFLLLFAVFILYIELFKSTRTSVSSIVEHVLSMFVFIAFMIEFLVVEACGTSTFLIVTLLSLIDVIGGFTITISTARRDFGVGAHGGMAGD
tara:strand:+ start:2963 stop:3517 length:555 start_codon:yes stop_codon:yes gene_type:complete